MRKAGRIAFGLALFGLAALPPFEGALARGEGAQAGREPAATLELSLDRLAGGGASAPHWLYLPAPSGGAAPPPSDPTEPEEASWRIVATELGPGDVAEGWPGAGWFALDLLASAELVDRTLALSFDRHSGASRVFLNDRLLAEIGELPGSDAGDR